jgi:hypothetical protein
LDTPGEREETVRPRQLEAQHTYRWARVPSSGSARGAGLGERRLQELPQVSKRDARIAVEPAEAVLVLRVRAGRGDLPADDLESGPAVAKVADLLQRGTPEGAMQREPRLLLSAVPPGAAVPGLGRCQQLGCTAQDPCVRRARRLEEDALVEAEQQAAEDEQPGDHGELPPPVLPGGARNGAHEHQDHDLGRGPDAAFRQRLPRLEHGQEEQESRHHQPAQDSRQPSEETRRGDRHAFTTGKADAGFRPPDGALLAGWGSRAPALPPSRASGRTRQATIRAWIDRRRPTPCSRAATSSAPAPPLSWCSPCTARRPGPRAPPAG